MNLSTNESYTIDIQDNIIAVDSHGPFNKEVVELYSDDIKSAIKHFNGKPWGSLITYYGNGLFTPDAEDSLLENTRYRESHGLIAVAAILKNSNHADIQQLQLTRIYQDTSITFHVFCDEDSAQEWLSEFVQNKIAEAK